MVKLPYSHDSVLGIFLLINPFEKPLTLNSFAQVPADNSLFDAIEPASSIFDVETGDNIIYFDDAGIQQFVISDDTGFRLSSKLFAPASPSGDFYWGDDIEIQPGQAMLVFRPKSSSDATVSISQPFAP
jgi:hypothetical protein